MQPHRFFLHRPPLVKRHLRHCMPDEQVFVASRGSALGQFSRIRTNRIRLLSGMWHQVCVYIAPASMYMYDLSCSCTCCPGVFSLGVHSSSRAQSSSVGCQRGLSHKSIKNSNISTNRVRLSSGVWVYHYIYVAQAPCK